MEVGQSKALEDQENGGKIQLFVVKKFTMLPIDPIKDLSFVYLLVYGT